MNTPGSMPTRNAALYAVAALLALLMLPNLVWLGFGSGPQVWVEGLLLPTALLAVLFAICGDWPWLACLLMAPFAALAPVEAYYIAQYHHPTSSDVLATIVATNPRETREYLGHALIPVMLCMAAGLALALVAAWWSRRARLRWGHDSRAWVLAIAIVAPLATGIVAFATAGGTLASRLHTSEMTMTSLNGPIESGYPFGVFQRVAEYRFEWMTMRVDAARLDAFRFHARRTTASRSRQIYVLVIGEASRRDHWQLFGYGRATNPELSQVRNLIKFPDMLSSWPESITAIPMVVTRKPPAAPWHLVWNEASILRAMQEAGFETYWISNQLAIGKYDSPVSTYAYEAQHVEFLNHASWTAAGSYDEDLLQPLRDALHDSNHDLFIVLHMMGSHQSYDYRYPPGFRHFRPTIQDGNATAGTKNERIRNSYDNTILYTDHVLARIIDILHDSGATTALWYESDHGETLPNATCSMEGHGVGSRYDFQIPALFWHSDAYASAFPGRTAALRDNADKRTMSADTFESLIDMTGVDFPGHDSTRSLFSKRWQYRPRIVHVLWQTDYDKAVFGKGCEIVLPPRDQSAPG